MIKGTYEQVTDGLSPELLEAELKEHNGRERFESGRQIGSFFKGMQILASKVLTEDKAELKVRVDYDPASRQLNIDSPEFWLQPMVKVADQWKLGGSTRSYQEDWQERGSSVLCSLICAARKIFQNTLSDFAGRGCLQVDAASAP